MLARRLVAGALAVGCLVAPVHAEVGAADRRKLAKAFREILREPSEKKRAKLWKGVESAARKLTVAETEELVAEAVPGDAWDAGYTDDVEFESAGETWSYSVLCPRKRPEGLVPLVLDVGHASWKDADAKKREEGMRNWLRVAGCEDDVVYVRTKVLDALTLDGRYESMTVPPRKSGDEPNMDTVAGVVMDAVRDACLRYPVDPDRVVVQGISQTGFWTWWLAQHAPDRWSAVAPVGAVTWHVNPLLSNLVTVPAFVLHGTADPTCPFEPVRKTVEGLKEAGAAVDFRPTEGGGHMDGVFVRFGEIWPDMAKLRRDAYPKRFTRKLVSGTRPDAYWLRALDVEGKGFNPWGAPCELRGEIDGQTLKVTAAGCKEVVVLISSRMVDVDQKVTIELNGKKVWSKVPQADPETALDVARVRGDGAAFGAAVTLDVD